MLKSPSLFVSLQFPFTDLRRFIPEATYRLSFPNWPTAKPEREFIRLTGAVRARWSGGDDDWSGEEVYSNARSALLFENFLGRRNMSPAASSLGVACRFRRFFSNGVVARFELGLEVRGRGALIPRLEGNALTALLQEILELEVGVLRQDWKRARVSLIDAGPLLAAHFLRATTQHVEKKLPPTQSWWLTSGQPLLLAEYRPMDLVEVPASARAAEPVPGQDFVLHHAWLKPRKQTIGAWFLGSSPSSEIDRLRRLRIHLFRLHAERQGMQEILHQMVPHRLGELDPESATELWDYLKDGTDLLLRKQRYGVDQSELLKGAHRLIDQMSPGVRTSLLQEIEKLQRTALQAVKKGRAERKGTSANFGDLRAERDIIIINSEHIVDSFGRGYRPDTPPAVH